MLVQLVIQVDAHSSPEPVMPMYLAAPALLHVEVPKREKHIVYERAQYPGWGLLHPASQHCHIPACWAF